MKTRKTKMKYRNAAALAAACLCLLTACGHAGEGQNADGVQGTDGTAAGVEAVSVEEFPDGTTGITENGQETASAVDTLAGESAADGHVDFEALQQINPDIFAWLYVPGAEIDLPVLQSHESDEYYQTHTADGVEGAAGAVYTEMPNLMNLCDFNTILHGKDEKEEDLFTGLHKFEDPDFFRENEVFYLYLADNVLTYEIVAAYYDDGTDILRRYDYTTYNGCQSYLDDMYGYRSISKNMREGWDDLTPYHFLVTLDGSIREDNTQYVVVGVLIEDAAGTIDRMIWE